MSQRPSSWPTCFRSAARGLRSTRPSSASGTPSSVAEGRPAPPGANVSQMLSRARRERRFSWSVLMPRTLRRSALAYTGDPVLGRRRRRRGEARVGEIEAPALSRHRRRDVEVGIRDCAGDAPGREVAIEPDHRDPVEPVLDHEQRVPADQQQPVAVGERLTAEVDLYVRAGRSGRFATACRWRSGPRAARDRCGSPLCRSD